MLNISSPPRGPAFDTSHRVPPLTGVLIGTAISLFLWAVILGVFFILR